MVAIPTHHSNIVITSNPNVPSSRFVSFNFLIIACLVSPRSVQLHGENAIYTGEIARSCCRRDKQEQKQNSQKRRRGRELERAEEKEKELDGLEEGEGRERGRK